MKHEAMKQLREDNKNTSKFDRHPCNNIIYVFHAVLVAICTFTAEMSYASKLSL